jgi:hypothetical protein
LCLEISEGPTKRPSETSINPVNLFPLHLTSLTLYYSFTLNKFASPFPTFVCPIQVQKRTLSEIEENLSDLATRNRKGLCCIYLKRMRKDWIK